MFSESKEAGKLAVATSIVEVSVYSAREFCPGEPLSKLVRRVYGAMAAPVEDRK